MVAPDEALQLVVDASSPKPPCKVPLDQACGLQLAQDIRADRDYPPFHRAMMDGFAVRSSDAGKKIKIVGELAAGNICTKPITDGECIEIMTGAPCPLGADAVVPCEDAPQTGQRVSLPDKICTGSNIAPTGSECASGTVVLQKGQTLTPIAIAVLASLGMESVSAMRRPSMAIITTGAELVGPSKDLTPGKIRNSNGPMLAAMVQEMGIGQVCRLHAQDNKESILGTLAETVDRDIVLFTGGVSVGSYDLVPVALHDFGAERIFHKVTQKPGKPLLFSRKNTQLFFGLPGNPLACHLCFHRYVTASIRRMQGKPQSPEPLIGRLESPVHPKTDRTYFVAACARADTQSLGDWLIQPLPSVSSADIFRSCPANCYAEVPPGTSVITAATKLPFTWIGNAPWSH